MLRVKALKTITTQIGRAPCEVCSFRAMPHHDDCPRCGHPLLSVEHTHDANGVHVIRAQGLHSRRLSG